MKWPIALRRAFFVTGSLVICSNHAHAQGNAYSAPIGGRSALMGDTGIALGVDGAAPFLNPATIVRLDDQRFSFSVNFYSFNHEHYSDWHQPGPVDTARFGNVSLTGTNLTSSSFNGLPSTLCLFFTLAPGSPDTDREFRNLDTWRQKLAICIGTTETQNFSLPAITLNGNTPLGQTTQSQSLEQTWNRINIGPSYSVAVSRRFALGASLHGVYTTESYALDSSALTSSMTSGGLQSSFGFAGYGHSFDLSAIVGAIYSASPYTVGVSVTIPSVHVLGSYTGTMHNEYEVGGNGNASISNVSGSLSATPPVRLAAGIGAHWQRLTVELDESLTIPSPAGFTAHLTGATTTLAGNALSSIPVSATLAVQEHAALNTGVGAEYFVRKDFSLLGGLGLNLTSLPPLSPAAGFGNLNQERQDIATLSAGVGTYSQGSNLLLGFQLGFGWGTSLAVNPYSIPNELSVVDSQSYSLLFILSGSTSLKSLVNAAEKIKSVIKGDPAPPGASASPLTSPPSSTDPEKPRSKDFEKPGATEPEKPKSTEPEKPKSTEPEKPKSTAPEKPKSSVPENPAAPRESPTPAPPVPNGATQN